MSRTFTQHMTLHVNGGSEFSSLHYDVQCDGKPTAVKRVTTTNGSPKYLKTSDKLICGDEEFDILAAKGKGMIDWLERHVSAVETG